MFNKLLKIFIIIFIAIYLTGCNLPVKHTANPSDHQLNIAVSIPPQAFFVRKITGNLATIYTIISPGYSPETYSPSPKDIEQIAHTQIYFRIGKIDFEQTHLTQLMKINPNMQIVDTSQNIKFITSNNSEEGADPHIWLSPKLVQKQVKIITDTLVTSDPTHADIYRQNSQAFIEELNQLDHDLQFSFAKLKGKKIFVFHPAFGYLAKDYGFQQEYIQIDGKKPSASQIQSVITKMRKDKAKVIFVQRQFDTKSAQIIASEVHGKVIEVDPLAEDYLTNMHHLAQALTTSTQQ